MLITPLSLSGCFLLEQRIFSDERGQFVKTLVSSEFRTRGLRTDFVEQYHSSSVPGVIRGMHFQSPPHDHAKLVYCAAGAVTDVLLDLRTQSATYGEHIVLPLSEHSGHALYIASGIAHGFVATEKPALMIYNVTSEYAPTHDTGVRWDSFGFEWGVEATSMSERDRSFAAFADFVSPF